MRLSCLIGGESIYTGPHDPVQDAHTAMDAAGCLHCLDGHPTDLHCGLMASACPRTHDGPCYGSGPEHSAERPDGCTVCRPLVLEPMGTVGLPYGTMTDQAFVNKVMQAIWSSSTTFTITPGTSGGSAFTITPPMKLRLMTVNGSNTSGGTELAGTGYTAGGSTMGSSAFGTPSGAVQTNNNAVSWSVGSSWSTVVGIEIWDSAGTPVRYLFGPLTSNIVGAANGDTVQFASASISISGAAW